MIENIIYAKDSSFTEESTVDLPEGFPPSMKYIYLHVYLTREINCLVLWGHREGKKPQVCRVFGREEEYQAIERAVLEADDILKSLR